MTRGVSWEYIAGAIMLHNTVLSDLAVLFRHNRPTFKFLLLENVKKDVCGISLKLFFPDV